VAASGLQGLSFEALGEVHERGPQDPFELPPVELTVEDGLHVGGIHRLAEAEEIRAEALETDSKMVITLPGRGSRVAGQEVDEELAGPGGLAVDELGILELIGQRFEGASRPAGDLRVDPKDEVAGVGLEHQ